MGGVRALWEGDLRAALRDALAQAPMDDRRAQDGLARGGRRLAAAVVQRVLDGCMSARSHAPLRRHQIAWLTDAGWAASCASRLG